jgi:hypothetical protein
MVIPTVPPESPIWQDLTRYDYFPKSAKNDVTDICIVVGVICIKKTEPHDPALKVFDNAFLLSWDNTKLL